MSTTTTNGRKNTTNGQTTNTSDSALSPLEKFRAIVRAAAIRDVNTNDKSKSKAKIVPVKGAIPEGSKIGMTLNMPVLANTKAAIAESVAKYSAIATDGEPTKGTKTTLNTNAAAMTPQEAVAALNELYSL